MGARGKNWECPDLFELPVEGGRPGEKRWVLSVNLGDRSINGGSGVQYFVGHFDGRRFTPVPGWNTKPHWVDWGSDFYAAALCHKIFERFPRLRMASVENGASWVPDLLHRLDDAANRNPGYFRDSPRDVFGEHVWVTPFWEDSVAELAAEIRLDRLLLGSDWPHAEGTRQPADFVSESLAGFSPEQIRTIGRDNALDLLGIRLP